MKDFTWEDAQKYCLNRGYNLVEKGDGCYELVATPEKAAETKAKIDAIVADQHRRWDRITK